MDSYRVKRIVTDDGVLDEYCIFDKDIYINCNSRNSNGRKGSRNFSSITVTPYDEELELKKIATSYLNRRQTLNKNKSYLRRLMIANSNKYFECDKFVTLTFKQNIQSVSIADREFVNFIKRLKRFSKNDFKYLAVREKQKRGAIHYHVIFYNLEFIKQKTLLEIWNKNNSLMGQKKSGVNVKSIEEGELIISSYMSKYFLKQLDNDDFLKGRKIILKSNDLYQPIVLKLKEKVNVNELQNVVFACSFLDTKMTYIKCEKK